MGYNRKDKQKSTATKSTGKTKRTSKHGGVITRVISGVRSTNYVKSPDEFIDSFEVVEIKNKTSLRSNGMKAYSSKEDAPVSTCTVICAHCDKQYLADDTQLLVSDNRSNEHVCKACIRKYRKRDASYTYTTYEQAQSQVSAPVDMRLSPNQRQIDERKQKRTGYRRVLK